MAKEVNKRVNVWINGKEVENNIKSIRSAMIHLTNQMNKMEIGSEEYIQTSKKLRDLKTIYDEHCKSLKMTNQEIENNTTSWKKNIIHWGAFSATVQGASAAVQRFVSATQEYVDAYATIDDAMSAVQKTTGMTREEVELLKNSLQSIDTRTSTEQLLKIAEIGGRMGLAKEEIRDFTEAVNKANVALGDSFQGGAEEISSILGKISLAYKETRDQNIGQSITQIGSALNEVGASANATEGNIASFVQRVGSMPEVFRPTIEQAIALGAAFEESSIDAEVASRAFGIVMMKASTNVEGFAAAMHRPAEEIEELINTNPAQFFVEFAESLNGLKGTEIGSVLKDLKLNADGVNKIIGAMSTNTERFTEILNTSNTAFAEAISLDNEYAVVNENAAAQLEKAKKAVLDAKAALGEELIPVIIDFTKSSATGLKVLTAVVKFWTQHKTLLYSLVGAYTLLRLGQKKVIAAMEEERALTLSNTVAGKAYTLVTKLLAVAKAKLAADTEAAAAAQAELKAAFATTPWGAIIVAIGAVATGIGMLISKHREAKKAAEEFNTECAREQAEAEYLFDKLKKAEKGTKDYEDALQELKEKYPEIIQKHLDEEGALRDVEQAYKDVIVQIKAKIAEQLKEQQSNAAITKNIEDQTEALDKIREKLRKQGKSESEVTDIVSTIQNMTASGSSSNDIRKKLRESYGLNTKSGVQSGYLFDIGRQIDKMTKSQNRMNKSLEETDKRFQPFIKDGQMASDEIAQIDKQIADLQKQLYGENRKEIQKQIEDLKKLKQQKLDTAKVGSGTNQEEPNHSGSPTIATADKKTLTDRENFQKKLQQMQDNAQSKSLEGWEKTKHEILNKYKELETEAEKLYGKNSEAFKKVQELKVQELSGTLGKYLKTLSDASDKMMEEAKKMLDESNPDNKETPLIKAVFGEQQKWNEKINAAKQNIKTLDDIIDRMNPEDDGWDSLHDNRQKFYEQLLQLQEDNAAAISNVVRQHTQSDSDFIKDQEEKLARARMSDHDRQVAEINELYNTKIEAKKIEIAALEELLKKNPENADIAKQIEELKKLIEQLEKLQGQEIAAVPKSGGPKSVWQQLAEFDWSKMSENWQSALGLMSQGLQEFANAAFDIYGSIAQIQDNMMEAELQKTQETYDAKSAALQRQLNQGVISQKAYDAKMQKLNEEKEKKERKLKHEQFAREKTANIIQATIAGVLAAVESFKNGGGFPWGLIPMALSAATTAAQIAVIASQANPYAKGSYIRGPQLALMGEEGDEWVASNKLLRDKKTAAVIAALDEYQRGNRKALAGITFAAPDPKIMSQAVSGNGRTFAPSNQVTNNYYPSDNGELLKELRQMNEFLRDPQNRRSYISREIQLEFDEQEREVRELARL